MEVNAHMKYYTYEISHTKLILLVLTLAFFDLFLGLAIGLQASTGSEGKQYWSQVMPDLNYSQLPLLLIQEQNVRHKG